GNGAKIAFKTSNGANYVTARLDLAGIPVQATAPANGPWEQFTVEVKRTPAVTARRGIVRAEHRSWVDDQGPFNPLGGTLFWSLWGWKTDRERVKQNLQYLARFKFDYVRILCEVDWAGQTIDPNWPDYRENLASFMDYAYNQAGLRVELTLIGGGNGIDLMDLTRKVADVVADGRQHMVMNFEIANESNQRPLSLAQMRESGTYLRNRFPSHLVALSSAEAADNYGTTGDWLDTVKANFLKPGTANFVTVHMDRNPGDDGWRRIRQNWDYKDLDFPVSHNEPAGPRSSVSEEDDPVRLAMGRATGMINGVNAWVLHNAAGVFGKPIPERNRPPNLWEVANIDAVMTAVRNVDKWMPERIGEGRHWNNGWPGNPWNVDAFWGDGANHGVNRSYSVETAGGWVTTANGVKDYAVYTAGRRSRVEIFDVILGKVGEVTLGAGETYRVTPLSRDSGGYGAFVFVGHYL
ncbi:MAG TPA: hypothetical protein VM598_03575, partial [Bdellovibrionota bacterium]|nr:hypothetical protein [Bdellovibrionota bacterium]